MVRALDEPNPKMVAARTAQAIAVAVSTSRSYAAFVSAVTAVESNALLLVEDDRDNSPIDRCKARAINANRAAVVTALTADAGIMSIDPWPFNIHDTNPPESLSQTVSPSSDKNLWLTSKMELDEVQQQQQQPAAVAAAEEDAAAVRFMF